VKLDLWDYSSLPAFKLYARPHRIKSVNVFVATGIAHYALELRISKLSEVRVEQVGAFCFALLCSFLIRMSLKYTVEEYKYKL
jgi:uncharacterized membrane protein